MNFFKSVTLLLLAFLFVKADAQTTENKQIIKKEKKVIIITKTIDEDGNEVVEKIIKIGDEADDVHFIDEDGEEIEIEVQNMTDGVKKEIRIISDGNSDIRIIEGETDFIKELDEEMIQTIDVMKGENGNQVKIIMKEDGDENFNFEWEGDGEMPENIIKKLEEKGIKMSESKDGKFLSVTYSDEDLHIGHDNKAFLGVMIGRKEEVTNIDGVETVEKTENAEIVEIIEGSAAEEAGLKKGDVITSIDDKAINGFKDVVDVLGYYKPEDKISINYTRDGKAQTTEATLKGAEKHKIMMKTWTDEEEDGIHKEATHKKVIIIKKDGKKEVEITEEIDAKPSKNELDIMDIDLYPNPTDGVLKLNFKTKAKPTTITIADLSGKEYFKKELKYFKGEFEDEIDLKDAPKGALILTISQGKKSFSKKIIVE